MKIAESSDRINLKPTHHRFAEHLEAVGDYAAAIKHYQLSDTHRQLTNSPSDGHADSLSDSSTGFLRCAKAVQWA